MKKLLVSVLFVLCALPAFAQDTLWTRTYGGSDDDCGYSVQQTTDGGYIVAGWTSSFGTGSDVYLIRTDSVGDTLWTRTYGGTGWAELKGWSVQQTTDGGYIVVGATIFFGAGERDVYLIRTDSVGDTLWTRTYGGSDDDCGYSVQQTTDGGYIVAGWTSSFGAGERDVYLIRTDSVGDTLWTRTYGGSGLDEAYSVQQTTDGGYIVAGKTSSFGAGSDVYLIRTDSVGDTLWTRTYGGTERDDCGWSVQQTTDGGYIVAGVTSFSQIDTADVYLIRTDSVGDTVWTRTYGVGTAWNDGWCVQQTTDGGYIVAGRTFSFGAGPRDVYLIRTDSVGDTLWTRTYGGSERDEVYSVQQTTDEGYIVAGFTESFGAGRSDIYLIKVAYQAWPVADFSASDTSGTAPLTVSFTDLSTGSPTSWFWDFGDGNTDTLQNPTHIYTDTGYFDVKLVASDSTTTDSLTRYDYIHVTPHVCHLIDVPAEYSTIQEAIDAAWNCDTVLVAPGHYYERINFRGKAILVASNFIFDHDTATISSTIIDADTTVLGVSDTGSVVCFVSSEDTNSVITGFTIQNGIGSISFSSYSREGGGIFCLESSPTISHNKIANNTTLGQGGGIWCFESHARIVHNLIIENLALRGPGGGVCDTSSVPSPFPSSYIVGNLIAENESLLLGGTNGGGGGIACLVSSPAVCGNTIVNNAASNQGTSLAAGGVFCGWHNVSVLISSNIIADNTPYGVSAIYAGAMLVTHNDAWNNSTGNFFGGAPGLGDTTWGVNLNGTACDSYYNIISDPGFVHPDSDFHLQAASPCIDAGDNNAPGLPKTDFDGKPRIIDGNLDDTAIVDIGAFEFLLSSLPVLSWADRPGYVTDGVSPDTGLEGTLFTFRVVYSDSNNVPPQSGYPKVNIDLNGDGDFVDENEGSFTMGVVDVDSNYVDGREYLYNATLPVSSNCQYSFSAKNSYAFDAVGEPTDLKEGPVVLDPEYELDLYIHASDITFSDPNPDEGETFTVYATVHNNSDSNLTNVSVTFYHSEEMLDQVLLLSVPSNGSATASTELSFDTKGFYPIRVVVDEENSFQEWNELNNFAMRPVIVGDYEFPGEIVVQAQLNSPVYPHSWITVTGNAHYTPEHLGAVSGGTVTITIQETGAEYTTHTNDPGNFSKGFYGPDEAGSYSVIVEVTDYTLTDSATLNLDVLPPQSGADLIITMSMSQTSCLLENQEYTVEAEIFNLGDQDAQNFWTCLYRDGSLHYSYWVDQLTAGSSLQIDTAISFSSTGWHTVTGRVDVGDSVAEYNEGNNVSVVRAYVACDDPDITITNVVFSDYTPKGDQPLDITAWVENWGAVGVNETFGVEFSDNGIPFDTQYVTSLAPCGTQTAYVVSENFIYSDTMSHSFSIFADFENVIAECNEENNIYWAAFSVFPDLWPRNLEFSQDCFTWGDSLWFQVDIYNIGEETAESVWVSFLLDEVPIGEDVLIDSVPPGSGNYETRFSEEPWIVPEELDVTHVCRVVVDPHHEILEIRENNNELTRATPVVPCGDVNGDCIVNVGDIVYVVSYLYKSGPAPFPLPAADVNSDQIVDVGDVVYLINYLYRNGPAPECQTVLVSPSEKRPTRVQ